MLFCHTFGFIFILTFIPHILGGGLDDVLKAIKDASSKMVDAVKEATKKVQDAIKKMGKGKGGGGKGGGGGGDDDDKGDDKGDDAGEDDADEADEEAAEEEEKETHKKTEETEDATCKKSYQECMDEFDKGPEKKMKPEKREQKCVKQVKKSSICEKFEKP